MSSWTLFACMRFDERDRKIATAATFTTSSISDCHAHCESTASFESGALGFTYSRQYASVCICENYLPGIDPASCDGLVPSSNCDGFVCATATVLPVYRRSPPVLDLPSGWSTSFTCYTDDVNNHIIDGLLGRGFSARTCIVACDNKGYTISGVEGGDFCFCGNGLNYQPAVSNLCGANGWGCWGNSSDDVHLCGGSVVMSVFQKVRLAVPSTLPALPPPVPTDGSSISSTTTTPGGMATSDAFGPTTTDAGPVDPNALSDGISTTETATSDMTSSDLLSAQSESGTTAQVSGSSMSSASRVQAASSSGQAMSRSYTPSLSKSTGVTSLASLRLPYPSSALNTTTTATLGQSVVEVTSSGPSTQLIVEATIGGVLVVVIIGLILYFVLQHPRGKRIAKPSEVVEELQHAPSDQQAQLNASQQYEQPQFDQPQFDRPPPAFQYEGTVEQFDLPSTSIVAEKIVDSGPGNLWTINQQSPAPESLDRNKSVKTLAPPYDPHQVMAMKALTELRVVTADDGHVVAAGPQVGLVAPPRGGVLDHSILPLYSA